MTSSLRIAPATIHPVERPKTTPRLKVRIVAYDVVVENDEEHIEYSIVAAFGNHTWKVQRRFSEFRKLDSQLRCECSFLERPPSRITLGLFEPTSDWFCQTRQNQLDEYLLQVVAAQPLFKSADVLYDFLDVSSTLRCDISFSLPPVREDKRLL